MEKVTLQVNKDSSVAMESEQAVLGAMLLSHVFDNGKYLKHALKELTKEDFYYKQHRIVFITIKLIASRNEPVDIIMVMQELRKYGKHEEVPTSYLQALQDITSDTANIDYYISHVKQAALRRKLIDLSYSILKSTLEINEQMTSIQKILDSLSQGLDVNIEKILK